MSRGQALDRVPFTQDRILEDPTPLHGPRHRGIHLLSPSLCSAGAGTGGTGNQVPALPRGSLCSSDMGVHHRGCHTLAPPIAEVWPLSCRVLQDTLPPLTEWLGLGPPDSLRSRPEGQGEELGLTRFTSPQPQCPETHRSVGVGSLGKMGNEGRYEK